MFVGTRLLAIIAMVTLAFVMSPGPNNTEAGPYPAELELDFNISDGACVDIDPGPVNTTVGNSVQVAVCLTNPFSEEVAYFQYNVLYDDTIILAPEVADSGTSLDDNPDANVGTTTFTSGTYPSPLDSLFTCGAILHPKGDNDPAPGAGKAYSGACFVPTLPGVTGLVSGPLGVITFNAVSVGSASLAIDAAEVGDENAVEIGSCNPTLSTSMTCTGGTINVFAAVDLSLDFDTSDGACVDIDPAANVIVGDSFDVAVCLDNDTGQDINHFVFTIDYNDTIVHAPEVANSGTGLDDNPD